MSRSSPTTYLSGIHPLHALLLASTFPLFLGATLSDYAYSKNFHIQWSTFSSWLIAGGLFLRDWLFYAQLSASFVPNIAAGLSWSIH